MNAKLLRVVASVVPFMFAIGHLLFPAVTIDVTTISLLVLSLVPWILPLVKSLELPGGFEIQLKDVKNSTDKLMEPHPGSDVKLKNVEGSMHAKAAAHPGADVTSKDPISTIRRVAGTDPTLALVGLRIAIEETVIAISENLGMETNKVPLYRLLNELQARKVLTPSTLNGLLELIALGNQAAHGARVSNEAADWVLDVGPAILSSLEN
jgi:hypothetical protein